MPHNLFLAKMRSMAKELRQSTPREAIVHGKEIHIYPPTTFRNLGIEVPGDQFRLSDESFVMVRYTDPALDVETYIGLLKHPFRGFHLGKILYSISPIAGGEKDDWKMPDQARADKGDVNDPGTLAWLHNIHMTDPYIRAAYTEFDENHRDEWLRQREDKRGDLELELLYKVAFAKNLRDYGMGITHDFIARCMEKDPNVFSEIAGATYWTQHHSRDFKLTRVEDIEWSFVPAKNDLRQLTEDQMVSLGLGHALGQKNEIVADLSTRTLHGKPGNHFKDHVLFTNKNQVTISDHSTHSWYRVVPGELIGSSHFSTELDDYRLPSHYSTEGIYPLFAWKKDTEGNRHYLSQTEVAPVLSQISDFKGVKGDVMLARALAVFFTEPVREGLDRTMELMHGRRVQKMMTGQIPALASLYTVPGYHGQPERPGAARLVLSDQYPLFPALEAYAA